MNKSYIYVYFGILHFKYNTGKAIEMLQAIITLELVTSIQSLSSKKAIVKKIHEPSLTFLPVCISIFPPPQFTLHWIF